MSNWRIKVSLFLNYFVFAILLNSSGIAITQVQDNFGLTKQTASYLDPCKDISIAVVSFLISSYMLKLGYRRAMLIGLGVVTAACFAIPNIPTFLALKLMFVIVGSCFALIKLSVYSTIGIITKDSNEHIRFMNFIESFFTVGNVLMYFLFGYFTDNHNPKSTSWFNTYYVLGSVTIVAFLLLLSSRLDESSVKEHENESLGNFLEMFKLLYKPIILAFIISAFFYVLIEQSIQNFLPTFNKDVLQIPKSLSILLTSILAASAALGRFLAGIVLKKIPWFYVLFTCLIIASALVLFVMPLAKNAVMKPDMGWADAPAAAYMFPLIGLFLAPIYPSINSAALSSLPKEKHGLMSGLIIVFSAIGGTAGSLITGGIFDAFGGTTAFYFTLVPIGILMISLFAFNRLHKKTVAVSEPV